MDRPTEVTRLLARAGKGDNRALDRLLPLVYDELRRLAVGMMQQERPDHTLGATALVHEAYLKLVDQTRVRWEDQAHFYAVAGQAIRRILVDHARGRGRKKRGGGRAKLTLHEGLLAGYEQAVDLEALDQALGELAATNPEHARIVEMRFFGGLTIGETAGIIGASTRTVERKWRFARAWLYQELSPHDEDASGKSHVP